VLLWFEVDDINATFARAEQMKAQADAASSQSAVWYRRPDHWEVWLPDPDGYTRGPLASPDGSAA
jgi:hypothetical protein